MIQINFTGVKFSQAWNTENKVGDAVYSIKSHNLDTGGLTPQRKLLHEVITHAFTERRIDVDPEPRIFLASNLLIK